MITAVGPFYKSDGTVVVGRMRFRPLSLPALVGGEAVVDNEIAVTADALGAFRQQLAPGGWVVTFPSLQGAGPIHLDVPDENGDRDVEDLVVLNPAAAFPGVYTKAEVDALIAGIVGGQAGTHEGSGAPAAGLGVNGNTYWDYTNRIFYVKDRNLGWKELIA